MGAGEGRVRKTLAHGRAPAPKKRFSQNYLTDQAIARKIVAALGIEPTDVVIEIGPGPGALTQWLVRTPCKHIVAADVDQRALDHLRTQPWFDERKIELMNADILTLSIKGVKKQWEAQRVLVIGNIPYGITSSILFWLFDQRRDVTTAVITMQREVAKRCVAVPSTKEYGILSVASWFASESKLLFHIQPGSFFPKPDVTSSVVRFNFKSADPGDLSFDTFMSFIKAVFGQRRKVMSNALRSWLSLQKDVRFEGGMNCAGYDLTKIRSESLSPEELLKVYVSLTQNPTLNE